MILLRNSTDISHEEKIKLVNSFDQIIFDLDELIWSSLDKQLLIVECIQNAKKLGKDVKYITHDAYLTPDDVLKYFQDNYITAEIKDIFFPTCGIISYFKKINFSDKIFAVASTFIKDELKKAGYILAMDTPNQVEESFEGSLSHAVEEKNVGAVLIDYDANVNYMKIQRALYLVENQSCQLIIGNDRPTIEMGANGPILGMKYFIQTVMEISGKDGIYIGQNSSHYRSALKDKFNINNSKRTLIIRERIEDVNAQNDFQTLLVLNCYQGESLTKFGEFEKFNLEYCVKNLDIFNDILKSVQI